MTPPVFLIVGSTGGVGATTLSIELAKRLSEHGHTMVVDADLSGRRSEAILFGALAKLDDARAQEDLAVADVGPALSLFEMTPNIHGGFTIKAEKVESWYANSAQQVESFVVVDAPQPFAAAVRPFAVRAVAFVLVIEPTLLGVTGARAMQIELLRFGVPPSRIVGIVSARDSKSEMPAGEIAKSLRMNVIAEVPPQADKRFGRAVSTMTAELMKMPPSDALMALQPSASTPLGERRLGRSAERGTPQASSGEKRIVTRVRINRTSRDELKTEIHRELSKRVDFVAVAGGNPDQLKLEELRVQIEEAVAELVAKR
ncbi:MAG: hypothetical protein KGM44_04580, partial [bacterium]|nr:hypothetical protein [bacterium]